VIRNGKRGVIRNQWGRREEKKVEVAENVQSTNQAGPLTVGGGARRTAVGEGN